MSADNLQNKWGYAMASDKVGKATFTGNGKQSSRRIRAALRNALWCGTGIITGFGLFDLRYDASGEPLLPLACFIVATLIAIATVDIEP